VDELLDHVPPGRRLCVDARQWTDFSPTGMTSPLEGFVKTDEQIEIYVEKGRAILVEQVRSEKIVPILGTREIFKKSAVIVTRRIEVNLMVTPQRKSLYDLMVQRMTETMGDGRRTKRGSLSDNLTQRETAELYKVFMLLAELKKETQR